MQKRHNCETACSNLFNGILVVKISYVLTDLRAIKDEPDFVLHEQKILAGSILFETII